MQMNWRFIFSCVFLYSCGNAPMPEDQDELYGVYGVLNPNINRQEIFVTRAVAITNDPINPDQFDARVKGAEVIVESKDQRVVFTEMDSGHYVDKDLELHVVPGQRYYLTVKIPSGKTLSGETLIPVEPILVEPIEFDSLDVRFQIDTTVSNDYYKSLNIETPSIDFKWLNGAAAYSFLIADTTKQPFWTFFAGLKYFYEEVNPYLSTAVGTLFSKSSVSDNSIPWQITPLYYEYIGNRYIYKQPETTHYNVNLLIYAFDQAILDGAYCNADNGIECEKTSNIENGFGYFGSINCYAQPLHVSISYYYK
ncbi:DUF4249 family protein [bacterium]|nr:DUF4249 family protein [bacterium]